MIQTLGSSLSKTCRLSYVQKLHEKISMSIKLHSKITGIGFYVPETVITNHDLIKLMNITDRMDITDEWIQERSGIKERRYAKRCKETPTTMGAAATKIACERANISLDEIDFIVFATLSPDYHFPGCGVLLQRELGIAHKEMGALDIRNQCSGFIYALSVADQFIKSGMYKTVLVVGSELQSMGLDFSARGRNVAVLFGDGAGAVLLQPTEVEHKGILTTHLHSNGTYAEELAIVSPGSHGGYHLGAEQFGFPDVEFGEMFVYDNLLENKTYYPKMNGQLVFKMAAKKFPEVIKEALNKTGFTVADIDMLIPHQANLRIAQFLQRSLELPDDKVFNNVMKYGNTTAASIPIALCEAWEMGKIKDGDLICLAAFGSGFTWGSALIHW